MGNHRETLAHRARTFCGGVVVLALTIAFLAPIAGHVVLNGTPSVKAHLLWKQPNAPLAKGDYVLAPTKSAFLPIGYSTLTKRVLCVEGDELKVIAGAFYCNGEYLHRAKLKTRAGAPLQQFAWRNGKVPEGMAYLGSSHPDGFDSRYLGFFRLDDLIRLEAIL